MTTIREFIFQKWKDTTADGYWKNINRFIEKYIYEDINEYDVINNVIYIQDYIDTQFNDKSILTKKTFINALHSLLRALYEYDENLIDIYILNFMKNQFDEINKEVVEDQSKRVVKTKSTLKDIYDVWTKTLKNTPEHIFLSSIILMPPRRCDWEHAIFVKEDDYVKPKNPFEHKYNYVIIKNNNTVKLEFYNFKTNKSCGVYSRELNNDNFKYLEKVKNNSYINPSLFGEILLEYYNLYPCKKYLLTNNPNGFCRGGFTNWVIRNPMKKLGFRVNDIRKIVITEIINSCGVYMDRNEKLEFAKDMGQKYLDIQEYYREVPIKDNEENENLSESEQSENDDVEEIQEVQDIGVQTEMSFEDRLNIKNPIDIINEQIRIKKKEIEELEITKKNLQKYNII